MENATATTPTNRTTTPGRGRKTPLSSARRKWPQTPHTIKALKLRAGATPFRRRSMARRRTPRDDLRILSRALAKEKREIEKQNQQTRQKSIDENQEDRGKENQLPQRRKSKLSLSASVPINDDDQDIVVPIDDDFDDQDDQNDQSVRAFSSKKGESSSNSTNHDTISDLEVNRRLSNRLSLAGPRLSDVVEFPGLLSVSKRRPSSASKSFIAEDEDDTVHLVPEDSFRIQYDDDMNNNGMDDGVDDGMNDDLDMGIDMDMDVGDVEMDFEAGTGPTEDYTLPLRVPQPKPKGGTVRKRQPSDKPTTAVPRKIIKDTLKTLSKAKITNEAFDAIIDTSNRFFSQVAADLNDYASHARRKKVDPSDVKMLMKRQRLINDKTSTFTLAHKRLPAELLDQIE